RLDLFCRSDASCTEQSIAGLGQRTAYRRGLGVLYGVGGIGTTTTNTDLGGSDRPAVALRFPIDREQVVLPIDLLREAVLRTFLAVLIPHHHDPAVHRHVWSPATLVGLSLPDEAAQLLKLLVNL